MAPRGPLPWGSARGGTGGEATSARGRVTLSSHAGWTGVGPARTMAAMVLRRLPARTVSLLYEPSPPLHHPVAHRRSRRRGRVPDGGCSRPGPVRPGQEHLLRTPGPARRVPEGG